MDFNLLADAEARSPALSLSDSGTPQHEHSCKGQDHSGECEVPHPWWVASKVQGRKSRGRCGTSIAVQGEPPKCSVANFPHFGLTPG